LARWKAVAMSPKTSVSEAAAKTTISPDTAPGFGGAVGAAAGAVVGFAAGTAGAVVGCAAGASVAGAAVGGSAADGVVAGALGAAHAATRSSPTIGASSCLQVAGMRRVAFKTLSAGFGLTQCTAYNDRPASRGGVAPQPKRRRNTPSRRTRQIQPSGPPAEGR